MGRTDWKSKPKFCSVLANNLFSCYVSKFCRQNTSLMRTQLMQIRWIFWSNLPAIVDKLLTFLLTGQL